jgi:hypothetical protein
MMICPFLFIFEMNFILCLPLSFIYLYVPLDKYFDLISAGQTGYVRVF